MIKKENFCVLKLLAILLISLLGTTTPCLLNAQEEPEPEETTAPQTPPAEAPAPEDEETEDVEEEDEGEEDEADEDEPDEAEDVEEEEKAAAAPAEDKSTEEKAPAKEEAADDEEEDEEDDTLYLNFEDATLGSVLNYLAEQKNINIIPNKDLNDQKVSLTTHKSLNLDQAWNILLTLLEANGYTLINVQGLYRVIKNEGNKQRKEPLPAYLGMEPEQLPDSELMIRYVYFFKNIEVSVVKGILDQLLDEGAAIPNADLNACVITEKSRSIKAAMEIIKELDVGGIRESIQIISLAHADADDIVKLFKEDIFKKTDAPPKTIRIFGPGQKKEGAYFSDTTKLFSDPRSNNLILLGTRQNIAKIHKFIRNYLDKPLEAEESRLHIKELKYIEAEKIQKLLEAIVKPPAQTDEKGKAVKVGKVKYFEDMVIAAEAAPEGADGGDDSGVDTPLLGAGNRLLIACNRDDWKRIESFIDKLDKPQPQVAFEILFVDVSLDGRKKLQAQIRNRKQGQIGRDVNVQAQHIANETLVTDPPLANNMVNVAKSTDPDAQASDDGSWLSFGRAVNTTANVWGILKAKDKTDNFNIISQPYVVVNNREKAKISIIEERSVDGPIIKPEDGGYPTRKTEKIPAAISVELKPTISTDGLIQLNIFISISEFTSFQTVGGTSGQPVTAVRTIKTQNSLFDGEVLILGGLMKHTTQEDTSKTPIVGDIPLLGNLFKGKSKTIQEVDLNIFIRPTIVKPRFEGKPGDYTQLKLDYAKLAIERGSELSTSNDPIQQWFFGDNPRSGPKRTLLSLVDRDIKQVEDFTEAKGMPRTTRIEMDPYYKTETSRTIQARKKLIDDRREELKNQRKLKEELKGLKSRSSRIGNDKNLS